MESEFLLVQIPTAWLHLAVAGVTLSSVNREMQGKAGAGDRDSDRIEPSSVRGHSVGDSAETLPLLFV